jgi:pSer/pThr/pTyr-binding forkhead associated (FHA) protein
LSIGIKSIVLLLKIQVMSNNKTAVPGMGNSFGFPNQQSVTSPMGASQAPIQDYRGTCFPGMNPGGAKLAGGDAHKPIMGFLFSVSRTANGEYWPLYLGQNTIGRATSCSVRLQEGMVTDNHAELVIRPMKNPDRIMAFIKDSASTCGTMLNGSSLGFDPQECHNGDIITIGEHYELYLILIDVKELGLAERTDFISVDGGFQDYGMGGFPQQPIVGQPQNNFNTMLQGFPPQQGFQGQPSASQQQPAAGGTVLMDGLKR